MSELKAHRIVGMDECRTPMPSEGRHVQGGEVNKWVIIGAIGNIVLCILNLINLWRHW